jgi:homoserine O-succinyltransferase/O-acetyltransferase
MQRSGFGNSWSAQRSANPDIARKACLNIALINNMPDSALEETERQFSALLEAASTDVPIQMKFYALPGIRRDGWAQRRIGELYFDLNDLWNSRVDGAIITGTEPQQPDLRQEPYWCHLADAFDWAQRNTNSVILSCLAAHAGVLFSDGIKRHQLKDKRFGLFDERKAFDHLLVRGAPEVMPFPHSRWNELREDELTSAGYSVLTKSENGGPNLFVKTRGTSMFVHYQGHPEYGAQTLLKEYRRDIGRFVQGERETYPIMPTGYFDATSAKQLAEFRRTVMGNRRAEIMAAFPESRVTGGLTDSWRSSAISIYRNWLQYLVSRRTESTASTRTARPEATREDARR